MEDQDELMTVEEQNVELIYKYIEHSLQATSDSISRLGTRLTTLIGFSGLLLRFAIDLPQNIIIVSWNVAPQLKIIISIALALAIVASLFGLSPKASGESYTADELFDELEGRDRCYSMRYITLSRDRTLKSLDNLRLHRVNCLKLATLLITLATLLFAIDIILYTAV